MDWKLIGIDEDDDALKGLIKRNAEKIFPILDKREYFLGLCDDILRHYYYILDCSQVEIEKVRGFIKNQAMQNLEKAREDAVLFTDLLSKRFSLGVIETNHDIEVDDPYKYFLADYKQLKSKLKSCVLQMRSESRRVIKEAKEIFNNRKLSQEYICDDDKNEEYLDSVNYKYIATLNSIFALAGEYSEVADRVLVAISESSVLDANNTQNQEGCSDGEKCC